MAVLNPPGFLQNAGATHTAEQMRNWFSLGGAGSQGTTSLIPRGGIHTEFGAELAVVQSGSPAMSVVVGSGSANIPGTESSKQGMYAVMNDADVTLTIAASHATLHRIDRVCFKVEDSAYSGAANTSSLVVVTGTPGASPVAPAAPANSITLATVSIVANDTAITNGEITDTRFYYAASGGVIRCRSTVRPTSGQVNVGQIIYEFDTGRTYITHDSGATWQLVLGRMGAVARRVAAQTLSDTTFTLVSFDTEDVDTHGMFAPTSTNITIPADGAGIWAIHVQMFLGAVPTGLAMVVVEATGFEQARNNFTDANAAVDLVMVLSGSIVITVNVFADLPGASTTMTGSISAYRIAV